MASIKQRSDGTWRARYRDGDGREHAGHFRRKVDAQRWLDGQTANLVRGEWVDPRAGRVTFGDYAASWEQRQVGRPATKTIARNALDLHLLPVLGPRPMSSIRPSDLQAIVRSLEATHRATTIKTTFGIASRIFAAAVADKIIPTSPCRDVRLPKLPGGEITVPALDDVLKMTDAMPGHLGAGVVMLAGSGLRIGELLGLGVRHVDFLRRTVRVEQQRLQDGTVAPPKTASSVRTVPLAAYVVDALAEHLAAYPSEDVLFHTLVGGPVAYSTWTKAWVRARRKAGLSISTHDLRHFFASGLIAGGATVKQVQTALGHHSAAVTLEVYSHLWPGDDERVRTIVDGMFRGLDADSGGAVPGQRP